MFLGGQLTKQYVLNSELNSHIKHIHPPHIGGMADALIGLSTSGNGVDSEHEAVFSWIAVQNKVHAPLHNKGLPDGNPLLCQPALYLQSLIQ